MNDEFNDLKLRTSGLEDFYCDLLATNQKLLINFINEIHRLFKEHNDDLIELKAGVDALLFFLRDYLEELEYCVNPHALTGYVNDVISNDLKADNTFISNTKVNRYQKSDNISGDINVQTK